MSTMVPVAVSKLLTAELTAVVEREREVDEKLDAQPVDLAVLRVYNVVDLRDARCEQETKDKCRDVPAAHPEENVDTVQAAQQRKAVRDRVNDQSLARVRELEDHHAHQQEVDERPDPEGVG